jgi:hypothetical protein
MVDINDGIAQQAGEGSYAAIHKETKNYNAALAIGIDPKARSVQQGGPGGGNNPPSMPAGNDGMPNMQFGPCGPFKSKDWRPVEIFPGARKGKQRIDYRERLGFRPSALHYLQNKK